MRFWLYFIIVCIETIRGELLFDYFELSRNTPAYKEYKTAINKKYIGMSFQKDNYSIFESDTIQTLIHPCRFFGSFSECRKGLEGETVFESSEQNFVLKTDRVVPLYFKLSEYSYECSDEFMIKDKCGTMFEIHRRFNTEVLYRENINSIIKPNETNFVYFILDILCSGEYEIWYIIESRGDKFIQHIIPFYLINENC